MKAFKANSTQSQLNKASTVKIGNVNSHHKNLIQSSITITCRINLLSLQNSDTVGSPSSRASCLQKILLLQFP